MLDGLAATPQTNSTELAADAALLATRADQRRRRRSVPVPDSQDSAASAEPSPDVAMVVAGSARHARVRGRIDPILGDGSWLGPGSDGLPEGGAVPGVPAAEEPLFDPYGTAAEVGALAELRLPSVTLRQLHGMAQGSLARFLLDLRTDLGEGARVPSRRIDILSIHERYQKAVEKKGKHHGEEVVVRFAVLPGETGHERPEPHEALDFLKEDLARDFAGVRVSGLDLSNASVEERLGAPGMEARAAMEEKEGVARLAALSVPIGISAAFTGILIWLAAW